MRLETYEYIVENSPSLTLKSDGRVLQKGKNICIDNQCYVTNKAGETKVIPLHYIVAYKSRMLKIVEDITTIKVVVLDKSKPITKENIRIRKGNVIKDELIRELKKIKSTFLKTKKLTCSQMEKINQCKKVIFELDIDTVSEMTGVKKEIILEIYKTNYHLEYKKMSTIVDTMTENELENICTFFEEGASIEEIQDLFQIKYRSLVENVVQGEVWSFNEKQYDEYSKALGVVD